MVVKNEKNYIDGLICLPRIPYILNLLEEVKYKNEIIEIALEGVPRSITDYVRRGTSEHKKAWIDNFYPIIKENIDNLINNRGFIRQEAIYNDTYHTTKGIYLDN